MGDRRRVAALQRRQRVHKRMKLAMRILEAGKLDTCPLAVAVQPWLTSVSRFLDQVMVVDCHHSTLKRKSDQDAARHGGDLHVGCSPERSSALRTRAATA